MSLSIFATNNGIQDVRDAIHEAGHAVARAVLRRPFTRVTLADDDGPPRIEFEHATLADDNEREREAICTAAGVFAEAVLLEDGSPEEVVFRAFGGDRAEIRAVLGSRAMDKLFVERLLKRAQHLVEANSEQIGRVAQALLVNGELSRGQVFDVGAPFAVPA